LRSAKGFAHMFRMLWQDEEGLTTVEYALLLALVAIAALGAWSQLGDPHIKGVANTAANSMPAG
ncbi:MAG: Flp family type IVb pilin, partial [Armatimonadia bacterium]